MAARIIDGRAIATRLRENVAAEAAALKSRGIVPGLAVILIGDDPSSQIYVRRKITACKATGIRSFEFSRPAATTQDELLALIADLNRDSAVHGILLQLPLPAHLDFGIAIQAIDPDKDVDGLHPLNAGRLSSGLRGMVPCTPQGSLMLIKEIQPGLSGLHAVILGRSILFGKPMAQLLLRENCTVTQCHSGTKDIASFCRQADILIAAIGRPNFVQGEWIKPDAIVIDVGITRLEDGTVRGDVDYIEAIKIASAITPVPGGVGPMTIACLLANTLKASNS